MPKRKRMIIEKEKKHYFRDYKAVIIASLILLVMVAGLVITFRTDIQYIYELVKNREKDINSNIYIEDTNINYSDSLCDADELNMLIMTAQNIKISFKGSNQENGVGIIPNTGEEVTMYNYLFDIKYENITDNFKIRIKDNDIFNSENGNILIINYSDTEKGVYNFKAPYNINFVTYYVSIYSSDKTSCPNELLRKIQFTTPIYNSLKDYMICDDEDMKDFKYCKEETLTESEFVSIKEFFNMAEEYKNNIKKTEEENEDNSIIEFIKKNIIIISGILVIIVIVIIVMARRGDNNE